MAVATEQNEDIGEGNSVWPCWVPGTLRPSRADAHWAMEIEIYCLREFSGLENLNLGAVSTQVIGATLEVDEIPRERI